MHKPESVVIPDSVTNVGTSAFSGCVCLTSLEIPDGVISIGSAAFLGCAGLTSVTLPVSVKTVGENAFTGCGALTTVYYNVSETAFGRISVASGNEVILAAEVCFTHSFIRILLLPLKTVYAVGEEFEPAGIAAALFYDDSSVSLTSRLGYSGFDSSSPGTKTVMASYGGVQTEFEVTVTGSADPVEPDPVRSDPVEPDPAGDAPRIVVDSVTCQPGAGEVEVVEYPCVEMKGISHDTLVYRYQRVQIEIQLLVSEFLSGEHIDLFVL